MKDFFISYNRADRQWAEWVAWQLEDAGFKTVVQAWDFRAGCNFVEEMDRAAKDAKRTVAILSPDYLAAKFPGPEWGAAFARDPTGEKRALVPIRVRECTPEGLLGQVVYIDLVGLDKVQAKKRLLGGVVEGRAKPHSTPRYPGAAGSETAPIFPGLKPSKARHGKIVQKKPRHKSVLEATRDYEEWMGRHTDLRKGDLRLKHLRMRLSPYVFLRSTFYRWMQLWPITCPGPAEAPAVPGVGDLNVSTFGTWRDAEDRLAWGVNVFDEAEELPYTCDLTRLATSALLVIDNLQARMSEKSVCQNILTGYARCLEHGGGAFLVDKEPELLKEMARQMKQPDRYWARMKHFSEEKRDRFNLGRDFEELLPEPGLKYRIFQRVAGTNSLGRRRYVALAKSHGKRVGVEAKAAVPSAVIWAQGGTSRRIRSVEFANRAVHFPDPLFQLRGNWLFNRLAPDRATLSLETISLRLDHERLLYMMGWDTANVHLGNREAAKAVMVDLGKRGEGWLLADARAMARVTISEWQEWRKLFPMAGEDPILGAE